MKNTILIFSIVFTASLASLWGYDHEQQQQQSRRATHSQNVDHEQHSLFTRDANGLIPDAYMKGAMVSQYSSSGTLEYSLNTVLLKQYMTQDKLTLQHPMFKYAGDGLYTAQAEQGTLSAKRYLSLNRKVKLNSISSKVVLNTQQLTLDIEKKIASNNTKVRITSADGITTGAGIEADISNQILKIKGNVRGTYEP